MFNKRGEELEKGDSGGIQVDLRFLSVFCFGEDNNGVRRIGVVGRWGIGFLFAFSLCIFPGFLFRVFRSFRHFSFLLQSRFLVFAIEGFRGGRGEGRAEVFSFGVVVVRRGRLLGMSFGGPESHKKSTST